MPGYKIYVEVDTNDGDYAGNLVDISEEDIPKIKSALAALQNGCASEEEEEVIYELIPKGDWTEYLNMMESIVGIKVLEVTGEATLV